MYLIGGMFTPLAKKQDGIHQNPRQSIYRSAERQKVALNQQTTEESHQNNHKEMFSNATTETRQHQSHKRSLIYYKIA